MISAILAALFLALGSENSTNKKRSRKKIYGGLRHVWNLPIDITPEQDAQILKEVV